MKRDMLIKLAAVKPSKHVSLMASRFQKVESSIYSQGQVAIMDAELQPRPLEERHVMKDS